MDAHVYTLAILEWKYVFSFPPVFFSAPTCVAFFKESDNNFLWEKIITAGTL